jgi:O-antigen/teichoic acid export membrane protein
MSLNFLVSVILARSIGPRGYGIYAFALATAALLAIPSTAALSTLVVRETAGGLARGRPGLVHGLMEWATQRAIVLAIGAVALAAGIGVAAGSRLQPDSRLAFGFALAIVPLLSLMAVRAATLRGFHFVVAGQISELLVVPSVMLMGIGILRVAGASEKLGPASAAGFYLTGIAVALVITVVLLRARTPLQVRTASREYEPQAWAGAVVPLLFVSGFAYANRELGLLLVGSLAGAEAAGIYRVAVRGSDLVVFALTGIIVAISPRLARLHAESNLKGLRRLVRRGALASMLWAVPVAAVMIGTGRWLLTTVFGAAFSSGTTSLAILAAGQLINAATGPVGILLNMTGRERKTARGHAVALGVQLVSGVVLIPRWGVEGAAAATALSVAARNLIFVFEAKSVLRPPSPESATDP